MSHNHECFNIFAENYCYSSHLLSALRGLLQIQRGNYNIYFRKLCRTPEKGFWHIKLFERCFILQIMGSKHLRSAATGHRVQVAQLLAAASKRTETIAAYAIIYKSQKTQSKWACICSEIKEHCSCFNLNVGRNRPCFKVEKMSHCLQRKQKL